MSIVINHHYPESDPDISRRLGRIEKALTHIIEKVEEMALNFARLEQEIAQNSDVIQSVITLLTQIADAIRDAAANQQKVEALATQLDAQTQAMADAVAASTPAANSFALISGEFTIAEISFCRSSTIGFGVPPPRAAAHRGGRVGFRAGDTRLLRGLALP